MSWNDSNSIQENIFPRLPPKLEFDSDKPLPKPDVSIFDLLNAVNAVLKRFETRDNPRDIFEDKWTVSEKIESILQTIAERGRVLFSQLFESATSRSEIVCTFLALLELIRLKQLVCAQAGEFAEIEIRPSPSFNRTPQSPAGEVAMTGSTTSTEEGAIDSPTANR